MPMIEVPQPAKVKSWEFRDFILRFSQQQLTLVEMLQDGFKLDSGGNVVPATPEEKYGMRVAYKMISSQTIVNQDHPKILEGMAGMIALGVLDVDAVKEIMELDEFNPQFPLSHLNP